MTTERTADEDATVLPFPTSPSSRHRLTQGSPQPNVREAIGDVLRTERHAQDRTLADVAERAAVSLPYLSEIERGRKDMSSDVFESITRSLEIEPAEVLERSAKRLRGGSAGSPQMSLLAA